MKNHILFSTHNNCYLYSCRHIVGKAVCGERTGRRKGDALAVMENVANTDGWKGKWCPYRPYPMRKGTTWRKSASSVCPTNNRPSWKWWTAQRKSSSANKVCWNGCSCTNHKNFWETIYFLTLYVIQTTKGRKTSCWGLRPKNLGNIHTDKLVYVIEILRFALNDNEC